MNTFIKSSNKDTPKVINLMHVVYFYKLLESIEFTMVNDTYITWTYQTEEERDKDFQRILDRDTIYTPSRRGDFGPG